MMAKTGFIFRLATFILVILLSLLFLLAVSSRNHSAKSLDATEWTKVRGYIDSYILSQYSPAQEGEAGFLIDAAALKSRTDSNGDGVYLGEGDEAANAPVLVDVLSGGGGGIIQGTSVVTNWNTTAGSAATVNNIAGKVSGHEAAGFSTDIITYCLTGHTESVVAGAYGAISQAGGFGATPPRVLALMWGRYGWDVGYHTYTDTNPIAQPASPGTSGFTPPGNVDCTGSTPDSELVRCTAAAALGRVGAGVPSLDEFNDYPVDVRPGVILTAAHYNLQPWAIQDPASAVFNSGLADIDPGHRDVFLSCTPHLEGIVAEGGQMLGYNATFLKWGLPAWNNSLCVGQQYAGGAGYGLVANVIDTIAPVISNVNASSAGTEATVTWSTNEPATSMVEYGTAPGGPYNTVNDTILHTSHSITITGLIPGQIYYAIVSSYDGQANGASTEVGYHIEPCTKRSLELQAPTAYWASMADYNSRALSVDWTVANTGIDDAYNVVISSSAPGGSVTLQSSMPAIIGMIAAGEKGSATIMYQVPPGVNSFIVTNTASAEDWCGNSYTYP